MKYLITEEQLKLIENNLNLKSRAKEQEQEKEEYINNILKGKSLKELEKNDLEFILNLQPELLREYLQKIYPKYNVFNVKKQISGSKVVEIQFKKREKRRFKQIKDNLKKLNPDKDDNELFLMMPEHEIRITLYFHGDSINIFYITTKGNVSHNVTVYPVTKIFDILKKIISDPFKIW